MCVAFVIVKLSIIIAPTQFVCIVCFGNHQHHVGNCSTLATAFYVKSIFFCATFIMCATTIIVKLYTIATLTQLVCVF
jgi:hypothetical protein